MIKTIHKGLFTIMEVGERYVLFDDHPNHKLSGLSFANTNDLIDLCLTQDYVSLEDTLRLMKIKNELNEKEEFMTINKEE